MRHYFVEWFFTYVLVLQLLGEKELGLLHALYEPLLQTREITLL